MPKGSTWGVRDSIQPSTANLEAAYALENAWADDAGGGRDRDDQAGPLGPHDRQHRAGDVHWAEQVGFDLRPYVCGAELLEEPGVEVAGVVDEHVHAAEPVDGRLDSRPGGSQVRHVE